MQRTALVLALLPALLIAQPKGKGKGAAQGVDKIRQLKGDLYMITGVGANTLVRVTPEGVILIDTKLAGQATYDGMLAEINSVTPQPVKVVINTQHHPDHTGNNQLFIDAGAQVLALDALKKFMTSDPRTKDIPGPPTKTFAKDETLKLGGATVELRFYGPGHTGDDTMVYFPAEKYVMVSDQMTDANPIVDFANGGSALHWNDSLNGVLKLDFEYAIPGRGEPKTRAEVQAFRDKWQKLLDRARAAIKAGATRDNLTVDTADLGWTFNAAFYASLYDEMK